MTEHDDGDGLTMSIYACKELLLLSFEMSVALDRFELLDVENRVSFHRIFKRFHVYMRYYLPN